MKLRTRLATVLPALAIAAALPLPLQTAAAAATLTVTGRVSVTIPLSPHAAAARRHVSLVAGRRAWTLAGAAVQPLQSGSIVAATGTVSGSTFTVASARVVAAPRAVSTTGVQTVEAILAEWAGADGETAAALKASIDDAGNWFNTVSGQRLTGFSVTGTANFVPIADPGGCDQDKIFSEAVAAAGVNPASFDHVVVYFPPYASCSWAGLGEEPGNEVWLNGHTETSVVAHELGHNLGLWHAHSLECSAPSAAPDTTTVSDNCVFPGNEYGDPADTMGNEFGTGAPWYDAPHLAQLGWLGSDLTSPAPCVTGVHLAPYETAGAVRALSIDAGAEAHPQKPGALIEPVTYWLEARQATGLDAGLGAGLTNGVLLHMTDPSWTSNTGSTPPDFGTQLLDGTADGNHDFTDAAVPAGANVTTPQGVTISIDSVDSNGATVSLSTSVPSVPRSVVASAVAGKVGVSWQPPACTAGAAITSYTVTALNDDGSAAATMTTTGTSVTLPIAPTTDRQILVSAKNSNGVVGASAVAPVSTASITSTVVYTSPSMDQFQVTIAPSVANGGMHIEGYQVHCIGPDGDKGSYIPATSSNYSTGTYPLIHGATYRLYVAPIIRSDGTEGPASPSFTMVAGDNLPPSSAMSAPANTWRLVSSATVAWHGSDTGGAGLASYDVRTRSASAASGLGGWSYPTALQHTTKTSTVAGIAAGGTVCYAVRARDHNGNTSGWSAASCWSRPLDDRALTAAAGWTRGRGSVYYLGTVTSASNKGTSLKRAHVHASALLLVVTRCKTCGTVAVYEGTRLVKQVSLAAATLHNRVQITLVLPVKANGATISIKTLSAGKPCRIDALGLRAY